MGRILGVDLGARKVGLALTDPLRMFGSPLDTIPLVSESSVVERIVQLCRERGADLIVIGMPFQANGTEGEGCARARRIQEQLQARGLAVALHDERWTSRDAEAALRESGDTSRSMRGKTDQVAAALILQDYLRETSGG